MDWTIAIQLALLSATAVLAVLAALSARRAASFDLTRDFDALVVAVGKLQRATRSEVMSKVRQAGIVEQHKEPAATTPMPKDQLRRLWLQNLNGGRQ